MPKLYLIPNPISEEGLLTIPDYIERIVASLRYFIVEEEREGRRFLKQLCPSLPVAECKFFTLNEHTAAKELKTIFAEIPGKDGGLISDAGCPCVADPGAGLVLWAHQKNYEVIPLVGPSSILLALMASGLNGQNFAFNGYLPKERSERIKKIKLLEKRSLTENQTQIFMETPYRNQHVFEDLLSGLDSQTLLCVALDLTGQAQSIKTAAVKDWKKTAAALPKKPAVFLIHRQTALSPS